METLYRLSYRGITSSNCSKSSLLRQYRSWYYSFMNRCIYCKEELADYEAKYCSNKCQSDYNYSIYIDGWKRGKISGGRGVNTKSISRHVIRYIMEKYEMQCARCGWHEVNPATGRVALEIDHIDGNSENNKESNLILLCPNCHSLTLNYKNLNRGNGRVWRREKYVRIV